jgi:hypothetical protein
MGAAIPRLYPAAESLTSIEPLQVGAHGTGAGIPPVDEQVVAMRLITPAEGTLELSKVRAWKSPLKQFEAC